MGKAEGRSGRRSRLLPLRVAKESFGIFINVIILFLAAVAESDYQPYGDKGGAELFPPYRFESDGWFDPFNLRP